MLILMLCVVRNPYGLKQSPRAWFHKFSQVMIGLGFIRTQSDHSIFVLQSKASTIIFVVYIDDILII